MVLGKLVWNIVWYLKTGRIFCVRDNYGQIVSQSWIWRNQYLACFDNIEIPARILKKYGKYNKNSSSNYIGKILEVYKKATNEMIKADEDAMLKLLESGKITQEQFDSICLKKVTVGLGFNDIADAIYEDKDLEKEREITYVKKTKRMPFVYTDAHTQYIIKQKDNLPILNEENVYIYQDEIPEYDSSSLTDTLIYTMKRMEKESKKYNLSYIDRPGNIRDENKYKSIMENIAGEYKLNPEYTRILATSRMVLIYSMENDKIKLGDLLTAPIKNTISDDKKEVAKKYIINQVKKALKQINVSKDNIDITNLRLEDKTIIYKALDEIEHENELDR